MNLSLHIKKRQNEVKMSKRNMLTITAPVLINRNGALFKVLYSC